MEPSELKIALIGVSHWHVPLYVKGLDGMKVVAVSDENENIAKKYAAQLDCHCYTDYRSLVEAERPDFVFAFAPHVQMMDLSLFLIEQGIPFSMEKPMGMNLTEVQKIADTAEKKQAFIAIPFVWRYSDTVRKLKEQILKTKIMHLSFKFVAGPPSRYLETSDWMLSCKTSGGGCMTNLGVHFLDMALYLTDAQDADVKASLYQYGKEYDIELYASSMLKLSTGASLLLETGYAYPMDEQLKRENRWTIVTENGYYILAENRLEAREYGQPVLSIPLNTDSDVYYPIYVKTTLEDFVSGRTPRASVREMLQVRNILDRMNEQAREQ